MSISNINNLTLAEKLANSNIEECNLLIGSIKNPLFKRYEQEYDAGKGFNRYALAEGCIKVLQDKIWDEQINYSKSLFGKFMMIFSERFGDIATANKLIKEIKGFQNSHKINLKTLDLDKFFAKSDNISKIKYLLDRSLEKDVDQKFTTAVLSKIIQKNGLFTEEKIIEYLNRAIRCKFDSVFQAITPDYVNKIKNESGKTLLQLAYIIPNTGCVKPLLEKGAIPNLEDLDKLFSLLQDKDDVRCLFNLCLKKDVIEKFTTDVLANIIDNEKKILNNNDIIDFLNTAFDHKAYSVHLVIEYFLKKNKRSEFESLLTETGLLKKIEKLKKYILPAKFLSAVWSINGIGRFGESPFKYGANFDLPMISEIIKNFEIFNNAHNNEYKDILKALEFARDSYRDNTRSEVISKKITNATDFVGMITGWLGHSICIASYGKLFLRCNRGVGSEEGVIGINISKIGKIDELNNVIDKIKNNKKSKEQGIDYFNNSVEKLLNLSNETVVPQKAQVTLNCSWLSKLSLVYALFILDEYKEIIRLFGSTLSDTDAMQMAVSNAKEPYKEFVHSTKIRVLEEYLRDQPPELIDVPLLKLIRDKLEKLQGKSGWKEDAPALIAKIDERLESLPAPLEVN